MSDTSPRPRRRQPDRGPTKHDVDLAKVIAASRRTQAIIETLGNIAVVAVVALPLYVVQLMVRDIAGKTTHFVLSATITLSVAVTLGGLSASQRRKLRRQSRELKTLRARVERYERKLGIIDNEDDE